MTNYDDPILTIDVVLFALMENHLCVLLPKRQTQPFLDQPALIGGYIHTQEDKDTHAAAMRVLQNKIGIKTPYLEQLALFSGRERDPRGWSATLAYISMVHITHIDKMKSDFYPVDDLPKILAFDHSAIVHWAVKRIRSKSEYSTLPMFVMPTEFTLTELQHVYETMMGKTIDKATFRYKIRELDVVKPTGRMSNPKITNTRPARLYQAIDTKLRLKQWNKSMGS